jgi:hypothetical protein
MPDGFQGLKLPDIYAGWVRGGVFTSSIPRVLFIGIPFPGQAELHP